MAATGRRSGVDTHGDAPEHLPILPTPRISRTAYTEATAVSTGPGGGIPGAKQGSQRPWDFRKESGAPQVTAKAERLLRLSYVHELPTRPSSPHTDPHELGSWVNQMVSYGASFRSAWIVKSPAQPRCVNSGRRESERECPVRYVSRLMLFASILSGRWDNTVSLVRRTMGLDLALDRRNAHAIESR